MEIPSQPLKYIELVLDSQDQLVEQKRLPGENNVRIVVIHK